MESSFIKITLAIPRLIAPAKRLLEKNEVQVKERVFLNFIKSVFSKIHSWVTDMI